MDFFASPEPQLMPSVIKAEHIKPKYIKSCSINDSSVNISIKNTELDITYSSPVKDELWADISKYFQNDLNTFYQIIDSCFKEQNQHIKLTFIENENENIILRLQHDGLYPFNVSITIYKELEVMDTLVNQVKLLTHQNKLLKEKYTEIIDILRTHTNWINEEYLWLEMENVTIGPYNANINSHLSNEEYSGEVFSSNEIDKLKERMKINRYTCCLRRGNMKHYYYKYSWRSALNTLKILPENNTENTKIYIKIPMDDIKNIGYGLGDTSLNKDQKTYFHGNSTRQGYDKGLCHKMIVCHGEYKRLWESCKGHKSWDHYQSYCNGHGRNRSRSDPIIKIPSAPDNFRRLFEIRSGSGSQYFNIIMPIKYYCTNCKKVEECFPCGKGENNPGWEIYECLGHSDECLGHSDECLDN